MITHKKLPFSKIIKQPFINKKQSINLVIGYDEAWELAQERINAGLPALVLNPKANIHNIYFPVEKRDILIIDYGIESMDFIEQLFIILEFYGCNFIYVLSLHNKLINSMVWQRDE